MFLGLGETRPRGISLRLRPGDADFGTVVEGHMEYYSFLAPADQLALTLTVTPTSGNPNLYVNTGGARWPNSCAARLALACPRAP